MKKKFEKKINAKITDVDDERAWRNTSALSTSNPTDKAEWEKPPPNKQSYYRELYAKTEARARKGSSAVAGAWMDVLLKEKPSALIAKHHQRQLGQQQQQQQQQQLLQEHQSEQQQHSFMTGVIGPAWTRDEMEAPAGEKDMGGWVASVYTSEQQVRLGVDETGQPVPKEKAEEIQSNGTAKDRIEENNSKETVHSAGAGTKKQPLTQAQLETMRRVSSASLTDIDRTKLLGSVSQCNILRVSLLLFVSFQLNVHPLHGLQAGQHMSSKAIFMHFDPAGTELMPYDKFKAALDKMGFLTLKEQQKKELFEAMDINMDGFITFDEFDSVITGCRKFMAESKTDAKSKSKEGDDKELKESRDNSSEDKVVENTSGSGLITEEEDEDVEDMGGSAANDTVPTATGDDEIDELVNDISLLECVSISRFSSMLSKYTLLNGVLTCSTAHRQRREELSKDGTMTAQDEAEFNVAISERKERVRVKSISLAQAPGLGGAATVGAVNFNKKDATKQDDTPKGQLLRQSSLQDQELLNRKRMQVSIATGADTNTTKKSSSNLTSQGSIQTSSIAELPMLEDAVRSAREGNPDGLCALATELSRHCSTLLRENNLLRDEIDALKSGAYAVEYSDHDNGDTYDYAPSSAADQQFYGSQQGITPKEIREAQEYGTLTALPLFPRLSTPARSYLCTSPQNASRTNA